MLDAAALTATRRIPKAAEHQALGTVAEANEAARRRRAAEWVQSSGLAPLTVRNVGPRWTTDWPDR